MDELINQLKQSQAPGGVISWAQKQKVIVALSAHHQSLTYLTASPLVLLPWLGWCRCDVF